jgi:benzodiazapine receptor
MNVTVRLPRERPVLSLLVVVLACEVVGASGSVFTVTSLGSWYRTLTQPPLAPPDWVFGPVWTTLFALMGVAAWLVWREGLRYGDPLAGDQGGLSRDARLALLAFGGQFVLNVAWSAAFFGLQSPALGLVVIALLWLAIVATIALFARVDWRAAALMVPYLLWVSFASYLNYGFWALN